MLGISRIPYELGDKNWPELWPVICIEPIDSAPICQEVPNMPYSVDGSAASYCWNQPYDRVPRCCLHELCICGSSIKAENPLCLAIPLLQIGTQDTGAACFRNILGDEHLVDRISTAQFSRRRSAQVTNPLCFTARTDEIPGTLIDKQIDRNFLEFACVARPDDKNPDALIAQAKSLDEKYNNRIDNLRKDWGRRIIIRHRTTF